MINKVPKSLETIVLLLPESTMKIIIVYFFLKFKKLDSLKSSNDSNFMETQGEIIAFNILKNKIKDLKKAVI